MNARSSTASRSMRVLSPRMLPPEIGLDGSTLSTATFSPRSRIRCMPSASMKVLLPTPGTPVMPTRRDWPVCGSSASSRRAASSPSDGQIAFDQRDGAGQDHAVPAQHPFDVALQRKRRGVACALGRSRVTATPAALASRGGAATF